VKASRRSSGFSSHFPENYRNQGRSAISVNLPDQPADPVTKCEKPLIIEARATAIAATINKKSKVDRKRIAKKLRIFLIIVRV
jgi:hypothetical protein